MSSNSPLNAINVFEVSARLGSFQKAAKELCVTPGAVSRQVKHLEDYVGKKLFKRKSRRIELTTAGRMYYSKVGVSLDVLHKATQEIQSADEKEIILIETPLTFAMHWLIPRLADFKKQFPKIDLRLRTSSEPILVHREIDLFIRRSPNQFSGLKGKKFLTEKSRLVCAPEVLGDLQSWSDEMIYSLPVISMRSRQDLWPMWFRKAELNLNSVENQILLDNTVLAIEAAIQGLGIALIPELFLTQYIDKGSLVYIPKSQKITSGAYYYLKSPMHDEDKAAKFLKWIKNTIKTD